MHAGRRAALAALAMNAVTVQAGSLFGTVFRAGEPAQGIRMDLRCGAERDWRPTDARGFYRLTVSATGNCTLAAQQGPAIDVVVGRDARQLDLDYQSQPAPGRLVIHR
jgi:hypothetical protein